jgi:hypothetical protein
MFLLRMKLVNELPSSPVLLKSSTLLSDGPEDALAGNLSSGKPGCRGIAPRACAPGAEMKQRTPRGRPARRYFAQGSPMARRKVDLTMLRVARSFWPLITSCQQIPTLTALVPAPSDFDTLEERTTRMPLKELRNRTMALRSMVDSCAAKPRLLTNFRVKSRFVDPRFGQQASWNRIQLTNSGLRGLIRSYEQASEISVEFPALRFCYRASRARR